MVKAQHGENIDWKIEDLMPPTSKDIFDGMYRICIANGIEESKTVFKMTQFFEDADYLLKIPKVKISSVMYASLARSASLGEKKSPNSFADIGFISSYLPYCDAMFIDTKSRILIEQLPKSTPDNFRIDDFPAKIFHHKIKKIFKIS